MNNIMINKNQLLNGRIFHFSNEEFQESIQGDDVRNAEVYFDTRRDEFKILFNGAMIHSSKTFESLMKRMDMLISDWNLTFVKFKDTKDTILDEDRLKDGEVLKFSNAELAPNHKLMTVEVSFRKFQKDFIIEVDGIIQHSSKRLADSQKFFDRLAKEELLKPVEDRPDTAEASEVAIPAAIKDTRITRTQTVTDFAGDKVQQVVVYHPDDHQLLSLEHNGHEMIISLQNFWQITDLVNAAVEQSKEFR